MAEPARIIKNRFVKDRQQLRQNYLGPDTKASYQRELGQNDPRLHNVLLQKFRAIKMPEAVMQVLNLKVNDATKITQIRDICLNHMYANMGFTKRKYNSQEVNQMITYISSILFGHLRKIGKISQIPEFWKNHLRFINKPIISSVVPQPITKVTPKTNEPSTSEAANGLNPAREESLRQQERKRVGDKVYTPTYEEPSKPKARPQLSEEEIRRRNMNADPLFEDLTANKVYNPIYEEPSKPKVRPQLSSEEEIRRRNMNADPLFDEPEANVTKPVDGLIKAKQNMLDVLNARKKSVELQNQFIDDLDKGLRLNLISPEFKDHVLKYLGQLIRDKKFDRVELYIERVRKHIEDAKARINLKQKSRLNETRIAFKKELDRLEKESLLDEDTKKTILENFEDLAKENNQETIDDYIVDILHELESRSSNVANNVSKYTIDRFIKDLKRASVKRFTTQDLEKISYLTKVYDDYLDFAVNSKMIPFERKQQMQIFFARQLQNKNFDQIERLLQNILSKVKPIIKEPIKSNLTTKGVLEAITTTREPQLPNLSPEKKYTESIPNYPEKENIPVGEHEQIVLVSQLEKKKTLLKVYSEYLDLQNKYSDERKKQLLDYVEKQIDARGVDSEEEILRRLIPANFWAAERVYVPTYVPPRKQEERQIKPVDVERNRFTKPYFDEKESLRPVRKIIPKKEYTDILSFAKEHIGVFHANNKLEEVKILTEYSRLLDQAIKIGMINFEIAKSEFMELVLEFSKPDGDKIRVANSLIRFKNEILKKIGFVDLETKLNSVIDELFKLKAIDENSRKQAIALFDRLKNEFDFKSASKIIGDYISALNKIKAKQKERVTIDGDKTELRTIVDFKRASTVQSKFGAEFRKLGLSEIEIKGVFDEYKKLLNEVGEDSAEEYLVNYLNGLANSSKQKNDFSFYEGAKKPNILGASDIKDIILRQLETLKENKKAPEIMFDPLKVKELEASYSQYLDYAIANGIIKPEMREQLFNAFNKLFVKKDTAKIERMLWNILRKLPDKVVTLQSKPIEKVQTDNSEPEQLDLFRKKSPKVKGIGSLREDIARAKVESRIELEEDIKRRSLAQPEAKGKGLAVVSDPQLDLFYGPKVKYGPGKNGVFVKNTKPSKPKPNVDVESVRETTEDVIAKTISKRQLEKIKKVRTEFANRLKSLYVSKLVELEQINQILGQFDSMVVNEGYDAANDYVVDVLHELESKSTVQRKVVSRIPNVPVAPEIQQVIDQLNKNYDEYTELYNKFFADLEAKKEPEVLNKQELELSNKLKNLFEEYITSAINYRLLTPEKRDQLQRFFNSQLERRNFKTLNKVLSGLIESIYERYTRKIDADDLKNKSRTSKKQKLKRSMTKKDIDTIKLNDSVSELLRKRRAQNIEDLAKETSARTAGLVLPGDGKPTTIITGQETNPDAELIMPKKLEPKEIITNTRFGKGQRTESHSKNMKKLGPENRYATITNEDRTWFETSPKSDLGVVLPEEYDGTINPELAQNESDRAILIRLARKANQDDLMGSLLDKLAEEHLVRIDGKLRYAKDPDSVRQIEEEYSHRVIVKKALEELGKRIGNWEEGVNPIDINKFVFASVLNLEKANIAPDGTIIGLDLGSFGFRKENGKLIILNKSSKRQILEIPESNQDGIFVGTNKSVYEYRTGPFGFGKSAESNPTFFLEDNNDVRFVILRKKGKLRLYYLPVLK